MVLAKIRVSGVNAEATDLKKIPKGIVGATVTMEYTDPMWDGLTKTVVFSGCAVKDVVNAGGEVVIPSEVVAFSGYNLRVGVYGVNGNDNIVVPTLWADLGRISEATDPSGDSSTSPEQPVWAQLQAMIGDLSTLNTETKASLVAAVNEALTKGGGTVNEAEVKKIVENYLVANPPKPGENGKTAYQYAQDGGYTGTEAEFAEKMAKEIPDAYTLPVATSDTLGGVKPQPTTLNMTQPVGVDEEGRLWGPDIPKMIYPVGSVYMSVNDDSPGQIFGGSWEQMTDTGLIGINVWKRVIMGDPIVIVSQPEGGIIAVNDTAYATVEATGDDLTYEWYYKNPSAAGFSKSSNVTNTFSFIMLEERDGREVYCVITDANGNTVQTESAVYTMA